MTNETTHAHSVKPYILVFIGLGILTGLTVLLSYMGLPHNIAIALAILIATIKCTLIGAFFMHLRFERRGFVFLIISALLLVAVLITPLIQDIGSGR